MKLIPINPNRPITATKCRATICRICRALSFGSIRPLSIQLRGFGRHAVHERKGESRNATLIQAQPSRLAGGAGTLAVSRPRNRPSFLGEVTVNSGNTGSLPTRSILTSVNVMGAGGYRTETSADHLGTDRPDAGCPADRIPPWSRIREALLPGLRRRGLHQRHQAD